MKRNLRQQFLFAMLGVATLVLLLSVLLNGYRIVERAQQQAIAAVRSQVAIVAYNVAPALLFSDAAAATDLLSSLQALPNYRGTVIYLYNAEQQTSGERFVYTGRAQAKPLEQIVDAPLIDGRSLHYAAWIRVDDAPVGMLAVEVELPALSELIIDSLWSTLLMIALAGVAAMLLARRFSRVLTRPVDELASLAEAIVADSQWQLRAPPATLVELDRLSASFNRLLSAIENEIAERQQRQQQVDDLNRNLEAKVSSRTLALDERNRELELALSRLSSSQARLVEREKMASLGELVAGVAHEINTPVGIAVTATTLLRGETQQVRALAESKQLSQRQFTHYLDAMEEGSDIAWRNLERAAELIRSFKQVAVDQSSEDQRRFNLFDYCDEVINSLKPQLRRTRHQALLSGDRDIELLGRPGQFAQLLTNLVMNSLNHGFEGMDQGTINIELRRDPDGQWVHLFYRDNGKGVSSEMLGKLFKPFFTTKRNAGGSGLGGQIIYNIVNHALQGDIEVSSPPGEGLHYHIRIPLGGNGVALPPSTVNS